MDETCDRCKTELSEVGVHGVLDGSVESGKFCRECYLIIYGPGRESMIDMEPNDGWTTQ